MLARRTAVAERAPFHAWCCRAAAASRPRASSSSNGSEGPQPQDQVPVRPHPGGHPCNDPRRLTTGRGRAAAPQARPARNESQTTWELCHFFHRPPQPAGMHGSAARKRQRHSSRLVLCRPAAWRLPVPECLSGMLGTAVVSSRQRQACRSDRALRCVALLVSGFRCQQRQQWKWLASERGPSSICCCRWWWWYVGSWNIEHAAWRESRGEKSAVTFILRCSLWYSGSGQSACCAAAPGPAVFIHLESRL